MGILDMFKGKAEELRQRVADVRSNIQNQSAPESRDVGDAAREETARKHGDDADGSGSGSGSGEKMDTADRDQAERRAHQAAENLRRGDTPGDPP